MKDSVGGDGVGDGERDFTVQIRDRSARFLDDGDERPNVPDMYAGIQRDISLARRDLEISVAIRPGSQ